MKVGRKKVLTEEKLLDAIRQHRTRSPTELAKKLHVGRRTIYEYLENISEEQIEAIFKELSEKDLKAKHRGWDEFSKIPIIEAWKRKLLDKSRVSEGYAEKMMKGFWRCCVKLNRNPDHLTVEEASGLLARIRRGEIEVEATRGHPKRKMSSDNTRKSLRSFFQLMKKISGKFLSSEGIDASAIPVDPERASARLRPKHRKAFMEVLERKVLNNWSGSSGYATYVLPFKDKPILAEAMKTIPYAYYYWGNRKMSILEARIEDMQFDGEKGFAIQKIIDKGRHKTGRTIWLKRTTGELLQKLRALHQLMENPEQGLWFTFNPNALVIFFKECYKEAKIPEKLWKGMPIHIWRHTACQDLLDATNRNWELVAEVLSWKSIDTMKKHYGKASEEVIQKGLLEAMGIKVEWEKLPFNF